MSIFNRIDEVPYWAQEKIAGDQDRIAYLTDENTELKTRISELEKEIEKLKEESIFNFPAGTRVLINNLPNLLTKKKKKKKKICTSH